MKVLDPTDETRSPSDRSIARPEALDDLVVGLLDISKARGDVFLDRVEEVLNASEASRPSATPSRPSPSRPRSTSATRSPSSVTW